KQAKNEAGVPLPGLWVSDSVLLESVADGWECMKNLIFGLMLYSSVASPCLADDYKDGFAAYSRGDYSKALSTLRPLAAKGNPYAQHSLGVMNEAGHGIPIN
ncbi:hypothetical protein D0817_25810, partial [Flavobacterium cupreum]